MRRRVRLGKSFDEDPTAGSWSSKVAGNQPRPLTLVVGQGLQVSTSGAWGC
jgi:hypothetical protein